MASGALVQYLDGTREIVWQEPRDGVIEIEGWGYTPGEEPRYYVRRFVRSNVIIGGGKPAHLYIEEPPAKEPSE